MSFANWLKEVLGFETTPKEAGKNTQHDENAPQSASHAPEVYVDLPMEASEKELVAIVAACIAGQAVKGTQLHIQKIRRIQ